MISNRPTTRRRVGVRAAAISGLAAAALVLTACVPEAPVASAPPPSTTPPAPTPTPGFTAPPVVQPTGEVEQIATGLQAPWSILRLPGGGVLVSERDTARIVEVLNDGTVREAGVVADVVPGGEGGLMGLAHLAPADDGPGWVYAMYTAADDNRIVRMPLTGSPGSLGLGAPELVLSGIPKNSTHNGGRIAFGPDGYLYATAGDAQNRAAAQDPASPNGKILRMTPEGAPAPGNPYGNLVWSLGHRNPQGLAWDAAGTLWAAEFGQNTWDELNRITPGGNYGWPIVEGVGGDARFIDPVAQWATGDASPSGLAIVDDTLFLAALRGERLWSVAPAAGSTDAAGAAAAPVAAAEWFGGEFGRLRDAVPGPDGDLWVLSNNTDGRGSPRNGDDKLLRVRLAPAG